jgi:hypothetical protein
MEKSMTASPNLFSKYSNPVFVETGSYEGDGIQAALSSGFTKVVSIELAPALAEYCRNLFEGDSRVTLYEGDSSKMLDKILKDINEPVTFWLDGHWSYGETARGDEDSPLLKELELIKAWIKETGIKPTLLIDDMRCWDGVTTFTREEIISELSGFDLSFEDGHVPNDILVAVCK